jgi:hypothetical protein
MRDVHKIFDVSVTTISTRPLGAIVEIEAIGSSMKFELTEEIALRMCTDLERFLTQKPHPGSTELLLSPQLKRPPERAGRFPCQFPRQFMS